MNQLNWYYVTEKSMSLDTSAIAKMNIDHSDSHHVWRSKRSVAQTAPWAVFLDGPFVSVALVAMETKNGYL